MIDHVREIAKTFLQSLKERGNRDPLDVGRSFAEVLYTLDVLAFAFEVRAEFILARSALKRWAEHGQLSGTEIASLHKETETVIALLDQYGPLSLPAPRAFPWLTDADLKKIVERDYTELHSLVLPNGAWKSAIILAGSITEAILFALIVKDRTRLAAAKAHSSWPTVRISDPAGSGTMAKGEDKLSLEDLIKLATVLGLIDTADEEPFDRILRNYRNFVHPTREVKDERECSEGRALMAKGALDAMCEHFNATLKA